jgi:hypothetical protein
MSFSLTITCAPSVNAAMQQNHIPLFRDLRILNDSDTGTGPLVLKIHAAPEIFREQTFLIDNIAPRSHWSPAVMDFPVSWSVLVEQTERVNGMLLLELSDEEGRVLHTQEHDLPILAFDQWQGLQTMPELLASFITPNHPKISEVLKRSAEILGEWTGRPALDEYQSRNPDRVLRQAAAIYQAISEREITYVSAPASFEEAGQRIRLCDQLFSQGLGNCLDMSLLFAACAEAAGLNPLIVVVKGHAFTGLWLVEDTFADPVADDHTLLTKRIAEGIHDIVLLDAVGMNKGTNIDFEAAVRSAEEHLLKPGDFLVFIDVKRARFGKIRPLPLRVLTPDGWVISDDEPVTRSAAAPAEITVGEKPGEDLHATITRQQLWERKLLDLSLRNNLLNMRVTRSLIQLITPQLSEMEDLLSGNEELQLYPRPADWDNPQRDAGIYRRMNASDPLTDLVRHELTQKRIRCYLQDAEAQQALTELYRNSKLSLEENGANTLYLVLGILKWYETDASERPRYAPILLMPVEILRKSAQKGYVIRSREEDTMANITLIEMMRQDFDIRVAGLETLPRDEDGIDVKTAFNFFRHAILSQPRWDVEELSFIGHFSFSKFVMWNDIHTHADKLCSNKIVDSLARGRLTWEVDDAGKEKKKLDSLHTADILLPITADSSQIEAIRAALEGESFILHGPPGTGKSQTITNIIANALYRGKRVLFVAEKMAALEVVKKRLDDIGLSHFCLELHSNKARKTAVLQQLKAMVDTQEYSSPATFNADADRLNTLRAALNDYVVALHAMRPAGLSIHDCINRYIPHASVDVEIAFDRQWVADMTIGKLADIHEVLSEANASLQLVGDPVGHGLSDVMLSRYSPQIKEDAARLCDQLTGALDQVQTASIVILPAMGIEAETATMDILRIAARIPVILEETPDFDGNLLAPGVSVKRIEQIEQVIQTGKEASMISSALADHFSPAWKSIDAPGLLRAWQASGQDWFLPRFFTRRRIRRTLGQVSLTGVVAMEDLDQHLQRMTEYARLAGLISTAGSWMAPLWGAYWKDVDTDWEDLTSITQSLRSIRDLGAGLTMDVRGFDTWLTTFGSQLGSGSKAWLGIHGRDAHSFLQVYETVSTLDGSLTEMLELVSILGGGGLKRTLTQHRTRVSRIRHAIDKLRDWCSWRLVRQDMIGAGLSPAVTLLETGRLSPGLLGSAVLKSLYRSMVNGFISTEPVLSSFNGSIFDEKVRRFTELTTAFETLTRQEICAGLHARKPNLQVQAARTSEVGILQKAIANNGRGLSIRQLFDQIPNLLQSLCPCMLMSPISVAQYLSLGHSRFDLVIFDEASQMPTSEAVGAVARGRNLVVVGDPRQMPPTNFFNSLNFDEENADKEDLESILDDCLALTMPGRHLNWHYRSRHESLIAFSNAKFYDNKLLTFPSTEEINSRVRWVPVEGYYDRGRTKHNVAEAKAIVEEVTRRALDPLTASQSIGIVTFNSVQQKLIQDLMDDAIIFNPRLEAALLQVPEPLFIKNLENVQGDERDLILFSVGYGKDREGRIFLNFGPLNREGGFRRLNVAVSRARYEMVVFSTLRPEDIDLSRTASEGVSALRAFLEYASKGRASLPLPARSEEYQVPANMEAQLALALRQRGYQVHTQVGCSGFRVDVAMLHPTDPSRYLLAILSDGHAFARTATARDRHMGMRKVLEQLGWRVHHVWSADWWEDPAQVIEKVIDAYQHALMDQSTNDKVTIPPGMPASMAATTIEIPLKAIPKETAAIPGQRPYRIATLDPIKGAILEDLFAPGNDTIIMNQIRSVMDAEAPVTRDLLFQRILDAWGGVRKTARVEKLLEGLLDRMTYMPTRQGDTTVCWLAGQVPEKIDFFRVPEDEHGRRDPDDLPAHEVAAAAAAIVKINFSLSEESLVRELIRVFGYARTGVQVEIAMRSGIQMALILGIIRSVDGRYLL